MAFCANCGNRLPDGAVFCDSCGTPMQVMMSNPKEEQEFLDTTHRLLRWEMKAWRIAGIVLSILGVVFAVIFFLMAVIVGIVEGDGFFFGFFLAYALILGGMILAIGIVNLKAAEKIPMYLSSVHKNFQMANDRCGNVGMLVFTIFFNNVALVFFIINFVRIKSNQSLIARIMSKQRSL